MVRENCEGSPFQEIPEMDYSRVDSKEFDPAQYACYVADNAPPLTDNRWLRSERLQPKLRSLFTFSLPRNRLGDPDILLPSDKFLGN